MAEEEEAEEAREAEEAEEQFEDESESTAFKPSDHRGVSAASAAREEVAIEGFDC